MGRRVRLKAKPRPLGRFRGSGKLSLPTRQRCDPRTETSVQKTVFNHVIDIHIHKDVCVGDECASVFSQHGTTGCIPHVCARHPVQRAACDLATRTPPSVPQYLTQCASSRYRINYGERNQGPIRWEEIRSVHEACRASTASSFRNQFPADHLAFVYGCWRGTAYG